MPAESTLRKLFQVWGKSDRNNRDGFEEIDYALGARAAVNFGRESSVIDEEVNTTEYDRAYAKATNDGVQVILESDDSRVPDYVFRLHDSYDGTREQIEGELNER